MIEVGRVQCETFSLQSTCSEDRHMDFTMANNGEGSPSCSDIAVMGSHSKFRVLAVPGKRRRPRTAAIQDTEELLHIVCAKLVSVQRERYIMECQAKIEACRQGRSFQKYRKLGGMTICYHQKSIIIN